MLCMLTLEQQYYLYVAVMGSILGHKIGILQGDIRFYFLCQQLFVPCAYLHCPVFKYCSVYTECKCLA